MNYKPLQRATTTFSVVVAISFLAACTYAQDNNVISEDMNRLFTEAKPASDSISNPVAISDQVSDKIGDTKNCCLSKSCGCCEPVWRPTCWNQFACGWFDRYAPAPSGCSGALRQGWLATPDGFFTREFHLFYSDTRDSGGVTDIRTGLFQFQYPLSRRIWIGLDIPYSEYVDTTGATTDVNDFDDITVTPKFLLHETRNLGVTFELGVRAPTGNPQVAGQGVTSVIPAINFWKDIGCRRSLRGNIGVESRTGGITAADSDHDVIYTIAAGRTITCHNAPLGDFTYYMALNGRYETAGLERSFVNLTPGFRFHIQNDLYFLSALQFPISNDREHESKVMFMFVKGLR